MKNDRLEIMNRYSCIFTQDECNRISIDCSNKNQVCIQVDLHGMSCRMAKRFINNIINVSRTDFCLVVIHGYIHGTALKKMLNTDFENSHICYRQTDPINIGRTFLSIA